MGNGVHAYVINVSNLDGVTVVRGNSETIAAGINFVAGNHIKPAVANLSAGARGGSASIDNAVRSLVNTHGVTFVTGAGNANENIDFVAYSPQRVPEAITVAAIRANDNRDQLINDLNTGAKTRAQVLREIVESPQVFNALYNEGWVARCYYLYLRRGPDANGFNAWLNVLNSTGDYRGIIHGFIYSSEYAARFQ